jgi:hypothetical protein
MIIQLFAFWMLPAAGQKDPSDNKLVGKWVGTWTGDSTGKFEMTFSKNADGTLSASLLATPDQGEPNTMESKLVEPTAEKIKLKFEGADKEIEVLLEGTFEGQSLKGSYSVRNKAQGDEVESGTWSAAKKSSRD